MFSSQNPDDSLEVCACSPYIPPPLCISIMLVTSLNDITIICLLLWCKKALCMCRRAALTHLHICQLPYQPIIVFPTAMQGPYHQFSILNFESVTLSPRYFGGPLCQSLKFIINRLKDIMYTKMAGIEI